MYLVNPNGQMVGVSDVKAKELLSEGSGFRKLTHAEQISLGQKDSTDGYPIHMVTHHNEFDGYGQSQEVLRGSFLQTGVYPSKKYHGQPISFVYSVPPTIRSAKGKNKVIYTMFESTKVPDSWIPYLKEADHVITPSGFVQEAFKSCGIDSVVIPLGYDHNAYEYVERPKRDVFTFLHYDAFNIRKGFDLVWKAFQEEFGDDESVRLVLKTVKTRLPFPILKSQYPNVDVIKGGYTKKQMLELLTDADAFVFPSRGEGFGLTPLEALGTGLPTIVTNGSGMSEYFNADYFYGVEVEKMRPSIYQHFDTKDAGEMVEPSLEGLKQQMRYVYEHREEAMEKGKRGAEWVRNNYTMDHTAKKLHNFFKDIEGMEYRALLGARETIREWEPAIVVERGNTPDEEDAVHKLLTDWGYKKIAKFNATPTYLYEKR